MSPRKGAPQLPDPPAGLDGDLRSFPFFKFSCDYAQEGWFILGSAEAVKATIALLCAAWRQQPPASVPNDERALAALSQAGTRWDAIKNEVLASWQLHSDNRLYHPALVEQARECLALKRSKAKAARARWRDGKSDAPSASDPAMKTVTPSAPTWSRQA